MDTDDEKGLPDDSTAEAAEVQSDARESGTEDVLPADESAKSDE